jgi:hypothetical protein
VPTAHYQGKIKPGSADSTAAGKVSYNREEKGKKGRKGERRKRKRRKREGRKGDRRKG